MTRARQDGLYLLLLGSLMFVLVGSTLERVTSAPMVDVKGVYYSARCLLEHRDPYMETEGLRVYQSEGRERSSDSSQGSRNQPPMADTYFPTFFLFSAPFAMLPWRVAFVLWMSLSAGSLILAAFLMWNLGASSAPIISGTLAGLVLIDGLGLFFNGNAAGIAVSLCLIAVWCFLEGRFVWAGVVCLALSLAIKPHDAGLVWLYFLLAGGAFRRRALQTLAVTAVLAVPAILWVSHVSPHWMQELHSNLTTSSAHGGINDPGLDSQNGRNATMVIDLQAAISIFRDDPRIYNPVSYLVCGTLLLLWAVRTLRSRFSQARVWLALAAIVPLTMLVTYHRPGDAKLLLLTVPACAMLWAEGGAIGRIALLLNTAGILLTGDIPLVILVTIADKLHVGPVGVLGKIMTVVLLRPASLILLAMGIFYLWVYVRRTGPNTERYSHEPEGLVDELGRASSENFPFATTKPMPSSLR